MKLRTAFFALIMGTFTLCGAQVLPPRDYLESKDIPVIMNNILRQHVKYKKIDSRLLRRSLSVYIDQADPDKIYFLKEEVTPYIEMDSREGARILGEFDADRYTIFVTLNELTQRAIHRSREIRTALEKEIPALIAASNQPGALTRGLPKDRSEKPEFLETAAELKERIRDDLIRFIAAQRLRVGEKALTKHQNRIIPLYESRRRSHEREYLYLDRDEFTFDANEKEHYQMLHILKALTASLDAHTAFFDSAEAYDMRVRLEKGFQGIGVVLQEGLEGVVILRLIEGGPAEKSGRIEPNDRLVEIDGRSIVDVPFREVLDLIRGKENSTVRLGIKRLTVDASGEESDSFHLVPLKRERVVVNEDRVDVEKHQIGDGIVGVIRLHSFYEGKDGVNSERDVRDALKELNQAGQLRGLVLDLRDNTGGFLVQAVKVAGLFIDSGVVVISKYGDGNKRVFRDIDGHTYYDGPLVVLTSRSSASAAEIVAQALQDYGKAIVIGDEQTYGKGSIQHQTITNQSSTSFFKVTVGRFYTVSGRSTQIRGVIADIVVPSTFHKEPLGEKFLDFPLANDRIEALYDDKLTDVDETIRYWYRRYYTPSLEKHTRRWDLYLDQLRKNSRDRIATSQKFQKFLNQSGDAYQASVITAAEKEARKEKTEDLQVEEAVKIVSEMVKISLTEEGFPESTVSRSGLQQGLNK